MAKRMEKEKRNELSSKEFAEGFWAALYQQYIQRIRQFMATRHKHEAKLYWQYMDELERLTADERKGGGKILIDYKFHVKPYLPWKKINDAFKDLKVDNYSIESIIFVLKPFPIEKVIIAENNPALECFEEASDIIVADCNKKIRQLSPLVQKLRNLAKEDKGYAEYVPLYLTVAAMDYDIECCRELVKTKQSGDKNWRETYYLDKNLKKSPQKHEYWNVAVSGALKILNPFCHSDNCNANCKKTHQKAITLIAQLLKILYTSIWKEDVKTIADRIKQKDYRNISS